jgi:hypothetical protein
MMTTLALVFGILAAAVVGFVVLWVAVCYLIAAVSGWRRLRRLYATNHFEGATVRFAGHLGRSRFRGNALVAASTPAGLYLDVRALFRFGAGPVLIPWDDIRVSAPTSGPVPAVTLDVPRACTGLRVTESVARTILGRGHGAP